MYAKHYLGLRWRCMPKSLSWLQRYVIPNTFFKNISFFTSCHDRQNHSLTDILKSYKYRILDSLMLITTKKGTAPTAKKRSAVFVSASYFYSTNTIFKRTKYLDSLILPNVKSRFSQVSITERKIFIGKENSRVTSERDRFVLANWALKLSVIQVSLFTENKNSDLWKYITWLCSS